MIIFLICIFHLTSCTESNSNVEDDFDTEVDDKMVKPFADKAREMHNTGKVGDMSDMVITEYGVHIMFYAGDVESVVNDVNALTFGDLIKQKTQLSSEKSLFDMVYDEISNEAYDASASGYVASVRKALKIEDYKNAYKDMYN